jgi:hypothetical protein
MNYSNTDSVAYRIANAIYQHGPMDIKRASVIIGYPNMTQMNKTVARMCADGDLTNDGGVLSISGETARKHFEKRYAGQLPPTPSRTFFVNRPLSLSRLPKLGGTRPDCDHSSIPSHFARLAA